MTRTGCRAGVLAGAHCKKESSKDNVCGISEGGHLSFFGPLAGSLKNLRDSFIVIAFWYWGGRWELSKAFRRASWTVGGIWALPLM